MFILVSHIKIFKMRVNVTSIRVKENCLHSNKREYSLNLSVLLLRNLQIQGTFLKLNYVIVKTKFENLYKP